MFPLSVEFTVSSHNGDFQRSIALNSGMTLLLGPNGSGKTHILRGLKTGLANHVAGKRIRFMSAGRMGSIENFRSDYDGHRAVPNYDNAQYGSKADATRRHNIETLNGDILTLASRPDILIKVRERLRKLFQRDLQIAWDAGALKINFNRLDEAIKPYSSGREASGLMHLVGILSALYDDEVGALLIDEPEVSLHPQLQAFLLREIQTIAGDPSQAGSSKIIVMATHSTEMVQIGHVDDLPSFVFCYDLMTKPVQVSPDTGELKSKKIQRLVARLGQDHKFSLFAHRALLVEGPTDRLICNALAQKLGIQLEASGAQTIPVIGKGHMPDVAKFMCLIGKLPILLVDADALADNLDLTKFIFENNEAVDALAADKGAASAYDLAKKVYADFCEAVDSRWGDIEGIASQHSYYNSSKGDEAMRKRRAALCVLLTAPDADLSAWCVKGTWSNLAKRLLILVELLESQGCFVLRKGAIEAYYGGASDVDETQKANEAADETLKISQQESDAIETQYADVLRCLRTSASLQQISEADTLKATLASSVAPALLEMRRGGTELHVQSAVGMALGDQKGIFDFKVDGDDLVVSLKSKILDVDIFPLKFSKNCDVLKVIESAK